MRFLLYLDQTEGNALEVMERICRAIQEARHGAHLLLHGQAVKAKTTLPSDAVSRTYGTRSADAAPPLTDMLDSVNERIAKAIFDGYVPDAVIAWTRAGITAGLISASPQANGPRLPLIIVVANAGGLSLSRDGHQMLELPFEDISWTSMSLSDLATPAALNRSLTCFRAGSSFSEDRLAVSGLMAGGGLPVAVPPSPASSSKPPSAT